MSKDSYYVSFTKTSPKFKVSKELYLFYMKFIGLESDIPISFEHTLLIGWVDEDPPYYMRDNHTFRKLTGSIDDMLNQIKEEFDDGYTHGMLCSHNKKSVVHLAGDLKEHECTIWLKAFLDD